MKWLWLVVVGAASCAPLLKADPVEDAFAKAGAAEEQGDYATAAQIFDSLIQTYPLSPIMDEFQLRSGLAYFHQNQYDKAVEILSKDQAAAIPPEFQAAASYYIGYAQLLKGSRATDDAGRKAALAQSVATTTGLINSLRAKPAVTGNYLELGYYNRALAYLYQGDLKNAEADVNQLLQQFTTSLQRPDYFLLLGNLYAREATELLTTKTGEQTVRGLAAKSIKAFDEVIGNPDARVQANDAKLAKGEVLYLLAALTPMDPAGYASALEAFRQVARKADLIPAQTDAVKALQVAFEQEVQDTKGKSVNTTLSRRIEEETARLKTLSAGPDPILQALIRIAQCYNAMVEGNEARTVLHRLARADLTPEQRQDADFALIYSYVLAGQAAKADAALTDYLAKHPGDAQAEGIRVQIGTELLKRGDAAGALAQAKRNLADYPKGLSQGDAVQLEVAALTALGRLDEAKKLGDDFMSANPQSPVAVAILLSTAARQTAQGDLAGALASYQKVRDTATSKDMQAAGDAGYLQTLQSQGKLDALIAEGRVFQQKYPTDPALPNILVMEGVALDQKNDPTAVTVLQDEARKFPADTPGSPSPFALFYIVGIYEREGKVPELVQAAADLQKAFPNESSLLFQAAGKVADVYVKQKKFDLAAAQYEPLTKTPSPEVAALAEGKIGETWLAGARELQRDSERPEAERRLALSEQAYLSLLKDHGDQLDAVDMAFHGLGETMTLRRSLGMLKQADFEASLATLTADLTGPDIATRIELAKAGLVFLDRKGEAQYPAALARFKAAAAAAPNMKLTRTEANQYGELLLSAKDYPAAQQVYSALLADHPDDLRAQADGLYGLGASYLAQGDLLHAKDYFLRMKGLKGGASGHPHLMDAEYGLALYQETSGQPGDAAKAKQTYAELMQAQDASTPVQAGSMLHYGRILEAEGHAITPAAGSTETAIHYYEQVDTLIGPGAAELSAEGLYDAGQAYGKAGDKANATKQYQAIEDNYKTLAPDWAAKAEAAMAN